MPFFFVQSTTGRFPLKQHRSSTCPRCLPRANINQTTDSAREDEIAAKIASLRKQKRLKSQSNPSSDTDSVSRTRPGPAQMPGSFDELPDWKKEQILQNEIAKAEAFMNPSAGRTKASSSDVSVEYKPKVSTWGVFPRPDNISRTFGGGKKIQIGGVDLSSEESKTRDEAVNQKLAAYRKARGIDMELEEKHHEEIEAAIEKAENFVTRSSPYEAIKTLQSVEDYVSDRSRLGGVVYLSLALAYDGVGKREEAKELYQRLRRNPFPEIARKAKHLLQGFEAMDQLKVDDETSRRGFRVTDFRLPDVNTGTEKRYETALGTSTSKPESLDMGTSLLLLALIAGPIAFVLLVLGPASR